MKITLLLLFFVLNFMSAVNAQTERFSNEKMQKCKVGGGHYDNCANKIATAELDALIHSIKFIKIKYNRKTEVFKMKGTIDGGSMSTIFIADKNQDGYLKDKIDVGASDYPKYSKDMKSFFITFKLMGNNHLFFYNSLFVLDEYDLKCLVE